MRGSCLLPPNTPACRLTGEAEVAKQVIAAALKGRWAPGNPNRWPEGSRNSRNGYPKGAVSKKEGGGLLGLGGGPRLRCVTIPDSGPAPVLARYSDFRAATPLWEELSLWIETHKDAKAALGWVREMNEGPKTTTLIAQPPHDLEPHNASMYHYTWGAIFEDKDKKEIWKFDKRFYTDPMVALKVPTLPLPPPFFEGIRLHEGPKAPQNLYDTEVDMVTRMNAGIANLPDITAKVLGAGRKQ
eukprot:gene22613-29756_t